MANYRQGAYTVKNTAKYVGRGTPRYRSGWELTFMMFLDSRTHLSKFKSLKILEFILFWELNQNYGYWCRNHVLI